MVEIKEEEVINSKMHKKTCYVHLSKLELFVDKEPPIFGVER